MLRHAALLIALLLPTAVFAQVEPGPPGPYVIDLHGAMLGVPNAGEFYPALPTSGIIPGRAFGLDAGAHVLLGGPGSSRLGFGASVIVVRGRVGPPDVSAKLAAIAPQVSLNFGTGDGWSYLGVGYGVGQISTHVSTTPAAGVEDDAGTALNPDVKTGTVGTLNAGGGARWFVTPHAAVGFDVRFYRFAASSQHGTPATMRMALSVGVSLR